MKLFGRMKSTDSGPSEKMQEILSVLKRLARTEQGIAVYYHRCAGLLPAENDFWEELAESEHRHSATIQRLHDMISERPDRFRPGQEFDPASIRIFEVFVRRLLEDTDSGSSSRKDLLKNALEIENSAIELHYHKIVKSRDPEFARLAAEIDDETREHLELIKNKVASA